MAQRQQNVAEPIPPFFIRQIISMESSVTTALANEKGKAGGKKMNATNAKALTAMRQKVKKTQKEYEKEVKRFQEVMFMFSIDGCLRLTPGAGLGGFRGGIHCGHHCEGYSSTRSQEGGTN